MDSHSKRVFITGINGFTGKYLSEYYATRGYHVSGISNIKELSNTNIYTCNLLDKETLTNLINQIQPNIVIHLAAISFVGHNDITEIYNVNVIGTQNLLEAIREKGLKSIEKVVLASSATVYGNQKTTKLSEDLCPNPVNHYGISKLAMEQVVKTYFNQIPIIITRPFNYTAPEQNINFVIPKIVNAFKNKLEKLEIGNIDVYREYNSIHFICECYYLLSTGNYSSEIVNLCSGETHSLKEVITKCKELFNHKLEIEINEKFIRNNEIIRLSGSPKRLYSMIQLKNDYSLTETLSMFY
jgi:nucleoside-diphosphate-sugar epimerase